MTNKKIHNAARLLGSLRSATKTASSRRNGKLGGRPRTYPPCPFYKNHAHRFSPKGHCYACGYRRSNKQTS